MRAKNQRRNFGPFGKSLGRARLNEGPLPTLKCRLSSKSVSHLATDVVIADEIFLWTGTRKTRNVSSLYMGIFFQNVVVEQSRFTKQSQKTVTLYQQSALEVPARLEFQRRL
jgi:hypothetical protein